VDTTVVEADVKYPTDSGLLTAATCRIASRLGRLANAGVKVGYIDRTGAARAYQHSIGAWLRRRTDDAKAEVLTITGLLADLAELSVAEATKALKHKPRSRRVRRMLDDLAVLIERTNRVIAQARCRVNGNQPDGATRLVSLHEPDARPIRKGRLGKPVEFGYKAQVMDNAVGIILDYSVHIGNPSDTGLLRPAIASTPSSARHRCW
jgi:transposase, IS5 family